jgi:hypothetical protein
MNIESVYAATLRQTSNVLGSGYRQGLPVITLHNGKPILKVIICEFLIGRPEGTLVKPPSYLALANLETSSLIELRAVDAADFDQPEPDSDFLDPFLYPLEFTPEMMHQQRNEMFATWDDVLPLYLKRAPLSSRQQAQAVERARKYFTALSEPPLRPYYETIGHDFFHWLDTVEVAP